MNDMSCVITHDGQNKIFFGNYRGFKFICICVFCIKKIEFHFLFSQDDVMLVNTHGLIP